jgi:predicted methyltransferase MtxX (methanogen marker protein 4)
MNPKNILNDTISTVSNGVEKIGSTYDNHIRKKAVERVNKKIKEKGLDIETIEADDYEAMVSDLSKDIREDYAKKAGQGLLAVIGLDFLLG